MLILFACFTVVFICTTDDDAKIDTETCLSSRINNNLFQNSWYFVTSKFTNFTELQ